jgi:uncharacterized protein YutE (UPF0331/DUF86 family)
MVEHLIAQKLESLQRCLARVQSRCPPTVELLSQDIDAQDVVVLNLSRAVGLCTDIALHLLAHRDLPVPKTMAEAFERLSACGLISQATSSKLKKAVGFRNLAVHSYDLIDWEVVFKVATSELVDLKNFASEISAKLPSSS